MRHSIIQTDDITVEVNGKHVYINGRLVYESTIEQAKLINITSMLCLIVGFVAGVFSAYVLLPELMHL
ncbi:TPA: hypothetical protein ACX3IQ_004025 [Vibrio parahaemolyticus]|uniref:hypothetical protein n=1 Tax=Vibrio TaxID=662 RepID=UPI00148D1143|nr:MULTISPECIES: hypothetical protein [Vibrio]MBS9994679.1 hypothetical protein [Vibrio alginolyticus]MDW1537210.1 hypothetical protein [Vibrio sp. Y159]MDW1755388.1 hypothetical protein [Vibrio sp. Vb2535]MDW1801922.1 hypothetical protein [Vibrio sp. Vb2201]MDW1954223.1 hypothetical protein [Vibrio sp. Vb0562]